MQRKDNFQTKRAHLVNLSEEELEEKFWELAETIVDPLINLSINHTTPSIERSVLLRMGFSSIEASVLINMILDKELISKGAGHIVYRAAKENNINIREAGILLMQGKLWDSVKTAFKIK